MKRITLKAKEYFQGVWSELKKVSWPTRTQVVNHTVIVIVSVVIAIGVVTVIDFGLSMAVEYIISLS